MQAGCLIPLAVGAVIVLAIIGVFVFVVFKPKPPLELSYTIRKAEYSGDVVTAEVVVKGQHITEDNTKAVLQRIYDDGALNDSNHRPVLYGVFAYPDIPGFDPTRWTVKFEALGDPIKTDFLTDKDALAAMYAPKQALFGLTDAQQRAVFVRIVEAENKADDDAEEKYPSRPEANPSLDSINRHNDLADSLADQYKHQLARSLRLTDKQLEAIGDLGSEKAWPAPIR